MQISFVRQQTIKAVKHSRFNWKSFQHFKRTFNRSDRQLMWEKVLTWWVLEFNYNLRTGWWMSCGKCKWKIHKFLEIYNSAFPRVDFRHRQQKCEKNWIFSPSRSLFKQKCMISGMPQSQITWLKDGQPLRTGSRVRLTSKDHVHITSVTKDDQGMFQCFVKNDVDMAQGVAEISLGEIAPILHYRFIEQTLQPGPGVSLKCTA